MTIVKKYYMEIEKIDYVDLHDHFKGNESIFLRLRERNLKKLVKKYAVGPFIDVGCGTGLTLRNLPKGSVGLDISPWNVKRAKINAAEAHLIVGDAENLPIKDKVFSTAVCSEVLEHLEHPSKAITEIHRILKEGGVLLGSVPHPQLAWRLNQRLHLSLSNKTLRNLLSKLHIISSPISYPAPFHKLYTAREIREFMNIFYISRNSSSSAKLWIFFVAQKQN